MADFSADEIQTAVEQLVQSGISTPNDSLGSRSTSTTFSAVQVATAGIFILYPLAPFYCVYLGAQRLKESLQAEEVLVTSLLENVSSLGRLVLPVTDLSPLSNAQAALQALSSAVSSGAPADITKLPQYQRYISNVNTFLTGPASAVKQNGAIVPTPQEAVAAIPGLVSQLQTAHVATVQAAQYLQNSITDFGTINLPSLVAQGVINNAATVLKSDTAMLAGLSASDRLAALRTPILNLLTAQSVVTSFGSFSGPSALYSITGQGRPYSDASHLATPASLVVALGAPYVIVPGTNDALVFTLDGGPKTVAVTLPSSTFGILAATIVELPPSDGGTVDGYLIGSGNDQLHFKITSSAFNADITVALTQSSVGPPAGLRTAQQIADDINAALVTNSAAAMVAEPYFYPSAHFIGSLNITPTTGLLARFDLPVLGAGSLTPVVVGDILIVASGANAGNWSVTAVNSSSELVASFSVTPVVQVSASVQVGPKDRAVRLRCVGAQTVSQQWTITIFGDTAASQAANNTLGFITGYGVTCAPSQASDVITAINTQQTTVTASSEVVPLYAAFDVTTDPTNPYHVIASKVLSSGALTYSAGTIVVSGVSGLNAAGVVSGDTVVLRGQGNTVWTITTAVDSGFAASGSDSAVPGASVTFEIGPMMNVAAWQTLQITTGPNRGNFLVSGVGVSPIDIILRSRNPIPHYADAATLQPLVASALLGVEYLEFTSPTTTTLSAVAASGTGVPLFWPAPPPAATGSSPYFFIPTPSSGGAPTGDDILEFFPVNYATPSSSFVVGTVDVVAGGFVLGVTPDVPDLPTTWSFGQIPVPFAALRHGHVVDFTDFQTALVAWLALPPQQTTLFFQNLNRVINPLVANTSPTAAQIGTALALIYQLAVLLDIDDATSQNADATLTLESILNNYIVDPVSQIDTLVKTYTAQGGDRAVDVLLGGQFSTFFGLSQDGTSYAGQMQASMRAVAQSDLPVRKVNRSTSSQSTLTGSSQSPDYEFDTSDAESGLKPDAPADFEKTTGSQ